MDSRYQQAHKEARFALYLTFSYLIFWGVLAYCVSDKSGIFGFPLWFELACIFTPCGFILACYLMIKYQFKIIILDVDDVSSSDE